MGDNFERGSLAAENTTFFGNVSSGRGGAIAGSFNSFSLDHVTITQNSANEGGGVFLEVVDGSAEVARSIVTALERHGLRALNPSMGFPMEMDGFPGRLWVVEHKTVAQEAGLGRMGVRRNVIHPRFGNFILLGTVLIAAEATGYDRALDYNPCLECKLCVAACTVGAIGTDGSFNFSSCYRHN